MVLALKNRVMARDVTYILNLRDRFSGKLKRVGKNARNLDSQLSSLRNTATTLFAGFLATKVIGGIIEAGSRFEQRQISFETMLGSAEKAKVLIKEITEFAIKTPFELKDVAKGAKNLLAFGIAEEKILPALKALGDVSAGLSVPIERLILNYGQVRSQSRLTGRELRDFAIAGVPLLDTLSQTMGKTTAELTKMIAAGDLGFPEVEKAFKAMSGEGGKFFDLMKKQTASTSGQISNLRDVVGLLQRDLFKRMQPAVNAVVRAIQDMTAFLRDNIDVLIKVGKVLGVAIGLFVAYKVIVVAVTAVTALFNLVVAANPILLLVGAIGAAILIFKVFNNKVTITTRSQKRFAQVNAAVTRGIGAETTKVKILFEQLKLTNPESEERRKIIKKMNDQYPELLGNLDLEKAGLNEIATAYDKIVEGIEKRIRAKILEQEFLRIATEIRELNIELRRGGLSAAETRERQDQKQAMQLAETRVKREIQLMAILKLQGQQGVELFKQREGLVRRLRDAEAPLFFSGEFTPEQMQLARLEQQNTIKNIKAQIAAIDERRKDLIKSQLAAGGGGAGILGVGGAGVTKITSAAPKIFNINIGNVVESFTVQSTTINEAADEIKRKITDTIVAAILDTQTLAR